VGVLAPGSSSLLTTNSVLLTQASSKPCGKTPLMLLVHPGLLVILCLTASIAQGRILIGSSWFLSLLNGPTTVAGWTRLASLRLGLVEGKEGRASLCIPGVRT
jgi:hypothetical protein